MRGNHSAYYFLFVEGRGSHPVVLRSDSWLCAQASLTTGSLGRTIRSAINFGQLLADWIMYCIITPAPLCAILSKRNGPEMFQRKY